MTSSLLDNAHVDLSKREPHSQSLEEDKLDLLLDKPPVYCQQSLFDEEEDFQESKLATDTHKLSRRDLNRLSHNRLLGLAQTLYVAALAMRRRNHQLERNYRIHKELRASAEEELKSETHDFSRHKRENRVRVRKLQDLCASLLEEPVRAPQKLTTIPKCPICRITDINVATICGHNFCKECLASGQPHTFAHVVASRLIHIQYTSVDRVTLG